VDGRLWRGEAGEEGCEGGLAEPVEGGCAGGV
jgi:hypothetical protein